MADNLHEFTEETLQGELAQPGLPILVDLWAPYCGSCRFLAPAVEALARECADTLRVGKLDVERFPDFAAAHGVQGVPTLLLFVDGAPVLSLPGVRNKDSLRAELAEFVSVAPPATNQ